jgi:hypothetical protein
LLAAHAGHGKQPLGETRKNSSKNDSKRRLKKEKSCELKWPSLGLRCRLVPKEKVLRE